MNAIQIQITQISNGWVVAVPAGEPSQFNPQGTAPKAIFCEDYTAVCECIKQYFPIIQVK